MISTRTIKREKCKFCGKELEQKTMSFIVGDREFVLSGEPVRCDCMKAKIYWKKVDDRRAAIEYKREYNRKMMLRKRNYLNSKMNKRLIEYNFNNYMTNNDNRMAYEKSKRYAEGFDYRRGPHRFKVRRGHQGAREIHHGRRPCRPRAA